MLRIIFPTHVFRTQASPPAPSSGEFFNQEPLFISSISASILSFPVFLRALLTKCCGRNCQVFFIASRKSFTFLLTVRWFTLSDLVNTSEKGTCHFFNCSKNSRSIFCGEWRASIKTNWRTAERTGCGVRHTRKGVGRGTTRRMWQGRKPVETGRPRSAPRTRPRTGA